MALKGSGSRTRRAATLSEPHAGEFTSLSNLLIRSSRATVLLRTYVRWSLDISSRYMVFHSLYTRAGAMDTIFCFGPSFSAGTRTTFFAVDADDLAASPRTWWSISEGHLPAGVRGISSSTVLIDSLGLACWNPAHPPHSTMTYPCCTCTSVGSVPFFLIGVPSSDCGGFLPGLGDPCFSLCYRVRRLWPKLTISGTLPLAIFLRLNLLACK